MVALDGRKGLGVPIQEVRVDVSSLGFGCDGERSLNAMQEAVDGSFTD